MNSLFLVSAGGAIGSAARYLTGRAMTHALGPAWPWGTLTVNLLGGLLMGLLVGALTRLSNGGEPWRLLLGIGVLGGFTTFSSFSLDVVGMIERGAFGAALSYALLSVTGSVLALFLGLSIARVPA
ncbi:fluoride efflux transporter CrcB [Sphingomonas endophytica]|uniref:Fluoride-specific ion channel FluC n=1 Tax=Sphingomonas endophytica TaxID=869719 RepID=A0A147HYE6_9SPHN|nr:fluoride efflux transporter CrcB [Sphingomonas endophytica]KTT69976.1 camphor resistance protein CrcB [Sphingomonas endophytica]